MKTTHLLAVTALATTMTLGTAHAQGIFYRPATDGLNSYRVSSAVDRGYAPTTKSYDRATDGNVSARTESFVKKATVGSEFEIESSQLALDRTKDPKVRELAQRIINDHERLAENLKASMPSDIDQDLAQAQLDQRHQQVYDKLRNTPSRNFNAEYIKSQRDAHDEAVNLFSSYAKNGDEKDLRDFAQDSLPTLRAHQQHAASIHPNNKAMGVI